MTAIKLLHSNLCADRYDYDKDYPKRRPFYVSFVKAHKPDIITLSEAQSPAASSLAKTFGMKSESYQGSSILYSDQFTFTRTLLEESWLGKNQTQSLLGIELKDKASGKTFNVLATHLPPFAWRATMRKNEMKLISSKVANWNDLTILATDANWSKTLEAFMLNYKWFSARLHADERKHANYATSGRKFKAGNPIDYVFARNGADFLSYDVIDSRKWSDHNTLAVTFNLLTAGDM